MSRTLRFRTPDMRFGLIVDATITGKILMLCRESGRVETGGILVGYYTEKHDWAIVTDVSGPPVDSKRGYVFFNRGVQGLQKWLNQIGGGSGNTILVNGITIHSTDQKPVLKILINYRSIQ